MTGASPSAQTKAMIPVGVKADPSLWRNAWTRLGRERRHGQVETYGNWYDTQDFVAEMRRLGVTPHVTQNNKKRRSAIDGRTTRHAGYAVSLRIRKRIEEVFGWMKTVGVLRKTRHRGTERVGWMFTFVAAACNWVRLPKLLAGVT